jgi:hypothetical protein
VSRLPPEILSQIVGYVPHEHDTDAWSIIRLIHVCRYWRELIVSTPWNWTSISSRSEGLAALSIQRAKRVPLKLSLNMCWVSGSRWFTDLINSHIQNADALCFSEFNTILELIQTLPSFTQSMPNLRSLTLDGRKNGHQKSTVDPFEPLAPTLRYLKLVHVPLYPSFLRLGALTELVLHRCRPSPHLDTLLDFLENNRSLKSVVLIIGWTRASLYGPQLRGAIVNQLQHLSITYNFTKVAKALLSNIPLQRGAHL